MPNNQFFTDWATGDIITAARLNQMKNDVQPYLGYVPVSVDQGTDTTTRYYLLGRIFNIRGFLKVKGILGGHEVGQGRANIDLQLAVRNGFRSDGYIMGTVGSADILARDGGDGWTYIYLITQQWALVNLEISKQEIAEILYNGTFTTTAPGGTTLYQLSSDFANNTHPNTLKLNNGVLNIRQINLAGVKIIESNSNSNGYFVRFADGTQICTRNLVINSPTLVSGAYGGSAIVLSAWTYPAAFDATPAVAFTANTTNGEANRGLFVYGADTQTSTQVGAIVVNVGNTTGLTQIMVNTLAIGRWYP